MKKVLDGIIRGFIALDYLIPPVVFLLITTTGKTPSGVNTILGPGYLRFISFLLLAAAISMFYDEELYIEAKWLTFIGLILTALSITWAVEEVIKSAYNNTLNSTVVPPFYHTPMVLTIGEKTLASRSGAVLIILSSIMALAILYGDSFEYSRRLSLLLAHISIPSIILLAGAIVAHPTFLMAHSLLVVELIKTAVILPIISLIIIDVYLVLETTAIRE